MKEHLDVGGFELQYLDSIWNTRSLRSISRSFQMLQTLSLRLLRDGDVGSREFRFCVTRLERLARCSELEVPDEYFAPITPLIIEALSKVPAATDQLAKYLRAAPTTEAQLNEVAKYLQDPKRNFYSWQNYKLWLLLVQKEFRDADLLKYAVDVVCKREDDDAIRCGATLYVGALGSKAERIVVAQSFHKNQSFLGQRVALLAVQELHFQPHIKEFVAPYLRDDLMAVYRGLGRAGTYVAPPEDISITSIIDMERES